MFFPKFYYFLENIITKEKKEFITFNYIGDINDIIAGEWKITDWTYEMEDLDQCQI